MNVELQNVASIISNWTLPAETSSDSASTDNNGKLTYSNQSSSITMCTV